MKSSLGGTKKLKPGILYIFNNTIFDKSLDLKERQGSEFDVHALQDSFGKYEVINHTYNNLTRREIDLVVSEIADKDFSEHSCIIVTFLSHGFQNYQIAAKDGRFNFYKMILKICTNITLKSKSKFFIVQACRGGINSVLELQSDNDASKSNEEDGSFNSELFKLKDSHGNSSKPNLYCDELYLLHSATEEFSAYRMPEKGSIFIQEFCKFFQKYAVNVSIEAIFEMVMRSVQKISIKCQQPEIRKNAVKPYIFGEYVKTAKEQPEKHKFITNVNRDNSEDCLKVVEIYGSNLNKFSNVRVKPELKTDGAIFETVQILPTPNIDNWTNFGICSIPKYPVIGGHDVDEKVLFVGRYKRVDETIPGKVFIDAPQISYPYDEKEEFGFEFELLNGTCYKWIKSDGNGHVPENAVPGGIKANGECLYIGRTEHSDSLQPGYIQPSEKCLYISFGGEALKFFEYDVLVREET